MRLRLFLANRLDIYDDISIRGAGTTQAFCVVLVIDAENAILFSFPPFLFLFFGQCYFAVGNFLL